MPNHSGELLYHPRKESIAHLDLRNRTRTNDLIFIENYSNRRQSFQWRVVNSTPYFRHLLSP